MADHLINTVAADGGYFNPDLAGQCAPGDTITIDSAHPLTYLYVGVLQGHADDPIIIRNKNGQAKVGKFDLTNCVGVKIDGSGDSTVKRGFLSTGDPNNQTAGVTISGYASDIEVCNIAIDKQGFGFFIKNETNCDAKLMSWALKNIYIHDNDISNTRMEGMYMGSTNFISQGDNIRALGCSQGKGIQPARLSDVRVMNNTFLNTGRGAIQLSFGELGYNEISGNTITNVGLENNNQQGNGINLGTLTKATVKNNKIRNTLCAGICSFGADTIIDSNDIDYSGYDSKGNLITPWAWGIWVDTRETTPFIQAKVQVLNNKIGHRGTNPDCSDIIVADQWGINNNLIGWQKANIVRGNVSTITNLGATLNIAKAVDWSTGITQPNLTPQIVSQGYNLGLDGQPVYYINFKLVPNA